MSLDVKYYEVYQIQSEFVTADLLVWQRYKKRAQGVVERLLDDNPQLAVVHRTTPFIPVGTLVRMPIDPSLLLNRPTQASVSLWTDRQGYRV